MSSLLYFYFGLNGFIFHIRGHLGFFARKKLGTSSKYLEEEEANENSSCGYLLYLDNNLLSVGSGGFPAQWLSYWTLEKLILYRFIFKYCILGDKLQREKPLSLLQQERKMSHQVSEI